MSVRTVKVKPLVRGFPTSFVRVAPAKEGAPASYRFAVSSEIELTRYDYERGQNYVEVLSHAPGAVVLERGKGGSLRDTHWGDQIGSSLSADLGPDRRLYIDGVRFLSGDRAQEIEKGINEDPPILQNVSIRYLPMEWDETEATATSLARRLITKWEYIHTAFEPDPADAGVGPGRKRPEDEVYDAVVRTLAITDTPREEERTMPELLKETTAAPAERAIEVLAAPVAANRKSERDEIFTMIREHDPEGTLVPQATLRTWLDKELTPDQVGREMLKLRSTEVVKQPSSEQLVKFNRTDARRYRYRKALAMAGGLIRQEGIEKEWHDDVRARFPSLGNKGSFLIPTRLLPDDDASDRAMDAVTAGKGAELVQPGPMEYADLLRNAVACTRMGARLITGLAGPVPFVRRTAGAVAQFVVTGKKGTRSEAKFQVLELVGKRLTASLDYGRELLLTASIDVESMVRQDLVDANAPAFDYAGLKGPGGASPLGLLNMPTGTNGLQTKDFGAAIPTWAKLRACPALVGKVNALNGRLGFMMTGDLAAVLSATPRVSGAGATGFIWNDDPNGDADMGRIGGYPALGTNQLTDDGTYHEGIFGPWQHLVFGQFGALEILVNPYAGDEECTIRVTSHQFVDVICDMPEAFVKFYQAKVV